MEEIEREEKEENGGLEVKVYFKISSDLLTKLLIIDSSIGDLIKIRHRIKQNFKKLLLLTQA